MIMIILIFLQVKEQFNISEQKQLVINSIPTVHVISVLDGTNSLMIGDSSFLAFRLQAYKDLVAMVPHVQYVDAAILASKAGAIADNLAGWARERGAGVGKCAQRDAWWVAAPAFPRAEQASGLPLRRCRGSPRDRDALLLAAA